MKFLPSKLWPKQANACSASFVSFFLDSLLQKHECISHKKPRYCSSLVVKLIISALRSDLLLRSKNLLEASSTKTTQFSKQSLRSTLFSKCHGLGGAASIMKDNEFE